MSITIEFFANSLNDRSDEDVINILTNKIREQGFEVHCFYRPYIYEVNNGEGSPTEKKGFTFDLKKSEDEQSLADKLHEEYLFNGAKIWRPKTNYESIIKLEKDLSHELLEEKIKSIKDFISLDDKIGTLKFNQKREISNQLYLKIYNYSKHEEIYGKIDANKQILNIVLIELKKRNKIGEVSKTSLNQDEIITFFQQKDYDGVIKDLRQFMTSICEFLSTLPNTPVNNSDTDLKKASEPMTKDNSEESESSSSSVANLTNSKPRLMPRPQLLNSSNLNSIELPELVEKANSEEPESFSDSDEISTKSKPIE